MNTSLWIGSIGLLAVFLVNLLALLFFNEIFPAFFSGAWWSSWFPVYIVWVVFLIIGFAQKYSKHAPKDAADSKAD